MKYELNRAASHIKRIVFDCFKYLNVSLHDYVVRFENQTNNIDLTTIDNGEFILEYRRLRNEAVTAVRAAKKIESQDRESAFLEFQNAFTAYSQLEELIETNTSKISWAKVRFRIKTGIKVLLWVLAAILSGVVSSLVACNLFGIDFQNLLNSFF